MVAELNTQGINSQKKKSTVRKHRAVETHIYTHWNLLKTQNQDP